MRARFLVAVTLLVSAGCTSSDSADDTTTVASTTTTEVITTTTAPPEGTTVFEVPAIGLTFVLPDSFTQQPDDPQLLFFARSENPPAIFTIAADGPDVVNYTPRQGETVVEGELDGLPVVLILNAALEGIPAGVSAHESLVANGDRSFTVIMSAPTSELDALWEVFLLSATVAA